MLENWLKPLSESFKKKTAELHPSTMGRQMLFYEGQSTSLRKVRIALIGADEKSANAVRSYLYAYSGAFPAHTIADLGNLRKPDAAQLIPVVYELLMGKIVPVIIGKHNDDARGQFLAYQEAKSLTNWAAVDETLRMSLMQPLLEPRHPMLFHYTLLGSQAHLLFPEQIKYMEQQHFENMRLGRVRTAIEEAEPLLRDADLLSVHLAAIRQIPGASPSGFFTEEVSQLARYAGMSDKLTSFGIYGYDSERDTDHIGAQVVAQLIWYFMEGFYNRKGDYPASIKGLNEYVVDMPAYNYQLTFWKSTLTGRWWLQAPVETRRKHLRHRLIPCTYQDYQSACRQELPDRLIKAFKRF